MAGPAFLRRVIHQSPQYGAVFCSNSRGFAATAAAASETLTKRETDKKQQGKWLILPPFNSELNGAVLGKAISGKSSADVAAASETTALKWVMKCCPQLPRSLVQKLFRLRQVDITDFLFFLRLNLYIVF